MDNHDLVRAGILAQIDAHDDIEVVGQAASVGQAADVIATTEADVVLLDVHLPGGDGGGGAEVIRRTLAGAGNTPKFLALSVSDAAADVVSVIRAGARGYVTKSINSEELIEFLQRVMGGDAAFSPKLAGFVLDAFGTSESAVAEQDEELDRLSAREQEVMRLIARGIE